MEIQDIYNSYYSDREERAPKIFVVINGRAFFSYEEVKLAKSQGTI